MCNLIIVKKNLGVETLAGFQTTLTWMFFGGLWVQTHREINPLPQTRSRNLLGVAFMGFHLF